MVKDEVTREDLVRIFADNSAYVAHKIGGFGALICESDPSAVSDSITFLSFEMMKLYAVLKIVGNISDFEKELVTKFTSPIERMLELTDGKCFDPSLSNRKDEELRLVDEALTAYKNLRKYYRGAPNR